jgi:hypothetical protein
MTTVTPPKLWLESSRNWAERHKTVTVVIATIAYAFVFVPFAGLVGHHTLVLSVLPVLAAAWVFGIHGAVTSAVAVTLAHDLLIPLCSGLPISFLSDGGAAIATAIAYVVAVLIENAEPHKRRERQ